ncbi:MAG: SpoIIE family protein phosphatase [Ardenticatenaceae bacterium]
MRISRLFQAQLIREIILFGVLAILMSFFFSVAMRSRLIDEFTKRGTAISEGIALSSVELLLNRDASTIQATIDQFVDAESGVAYVFVSDNQGQLIAHSFVPSPPKEILELIDNETDGTVVRDVTIANQGDYLDIGSAILAGTVGYAHVGMDQGVIEGVIRSVILTQIGLIAAIFVISVIIAYYQANRVSQPLLQLAQFARKVSSGSSSAQLALQASEELQPIAQRADEVGQLTLDFQRMVAEIYEREQKLAQRSIELAQANQEITDLSKRLKVENIRLGAELGVNRQQSTPKESIDLQRPKVDARELASRSEPKVTESSITILDGTEEPPLIIVEPTPPPAFTVVPAEAAISTVETTQSPLGSVEINKQPSDEESVSEIDVTRQLQQLLLPTVNEVRQIEGLEVAGNSNNQIAGDYYDQLMQYGRIQIGIANLNNDSLSNSTLMLMTGEVVRTLLTSNEKEQTLFLNTLKRTMRRMKQSLSLALLDLRNDDNLKLGGQGQQIMVVDQDGEVALVDPYDLGLPVGANAELVGNARVHFQPITGIVLYSTGNTLTQSRAPSSGVEKVQAIVKRHWEKPADAIVAEVMEELAQAEQSSKFSSDFSLLILKQK